ncbi:Ig kappa chain C region, A allele [Tupaia chinensis]|uniref:Ig kappa chain C region, A allele n=1 Tax=Tupaia chinensis TaxID=246437 RepID=L8Y6T3_TUPCH|nr:Ig kappa chain C region, A allele [Tupaia chinensis]
MLEPSLWFTFGQGTKREIKCNDARPTAAIFQTFLEEKLTGSATVVCFINNFYPRDIDVTWKVDGVTQTNGIQNSVTEQSSEDSTYSLSSTLTMTSTAFDRHDNFVCEVRHKSLSSPLIKSFNRKDH